MGFFWNRGPSRDAKLENALQEIATLKKAVYELKEATRIYESDISTEWLLGRVNKSVNVNDVLLCLVDYVGAEITFKSAMREHVMISKKAKGKK